jgi:hypothetical protein
VVISTEVKFFFSPHDGEAVPISENACCIYCATAKKEDHEFITIFIQILKTTFLLLFSAMTSMRTPKIMFSA